MVAPPVPDLPPVSGWPPLLEALLPPLPATVTSPDEQPSEHTVRNPVAMPRTKLDRQNIVGLLACFESRLLRRGEDRRLELKVYVVAAETLKTGPKITSK
jgi:hypothetical protein